MKFLLLLYLFYYLTEDSISLKDDDGSGYPRMYYLTRQGALSGLKQYNKKYHLQPLRSENLPAKLPLPEVKVKKTVRIPRNEKKPNDKAKSVKRLSPLKLNDKAKINKQARSKLSPQKKIQRAGVKWQQNVGMSRFDDFSSVELQSDENSNQVDYEYPADTSQKLTDDETIGETEPDDDKENEKDTAEDTSPIKFDKYIEYIDTEQKSTENEEEQDLPKNYKNEIQAGELADMVQNKRHFVPMKYAYDDLGRRFVLQYPYTEVHRDDDDIEYTAEYQLDAAIKEAMQQGVEDERLIPVRANPGLVLSIARQSALLEASKPVDPTREIIQNSLLRTGEYWNSYWKEEIPNPEESLRSVKNQLHPKLETVRVKIMPGSQLYQLVSIAKKVSPRLLYIINTNDDEP